MRRALMRRPLTALAIGALAALISGAPAPAEVLISESEAKAPPGTDTDLSMRGITRGPAIEQVSPDPAAKDVKSPLPLRVKFSAHNSATIDPKAVKVTYLRQSPVDLTARLQGHLTASGIDMKDAEVPPGAHVIRVDVKDSQGRVSTAMIKLTVAP